MAALKKLKGGPAPVRTAKSNKLVIPLQNQLMKIIRQCEVYLMEEAITDQIIKSTQHQVEPHLPHLQEMSGHDPEIINLNTQIMGEPASTQHASVHQELREEAEQRFDGGHNSASRLHQREAFASKTISGKDSSPVKEDPPNPQHLSEESSPHKELVAELQQLDESPKIHSRMTQPDKKLVSLSR